MLEEQINSVRRELDNLEKLGILTATLDKRKKFYQTNTEFVFFEELKSIFNKAFSDHSAIVKKIEKLGEIKLLILSGQFVGNKSSNMDILIVGDLDKAKLADFLMNKLETERPIKYVTMDEEDYKCRINYKDQTLLELLENEENIVAINKT